MRTVFLSATISGAHEYSALFKDVITFFGLIALFPMLIKLLLGSVAILSAKISYTQIDGVQSTLEKFLKELNGDSVIFEVLGKIGDIAIQIFVQSIYSVLIAVLLAVAPVFIFTSTILKLSNGIQAYFQSLLAMALWPVLWNLLGVLGKALWPHFQESPIRTVIFWGVIQLLQLLSPIFCIVLFRSMSSTGVISAAVKAVGMGL
ncbi:hypothetical protein [Bdellovibrio svalbardensis]|uniref:Yip1 domain-containing protein n=1 Tax=Bdellovibrio svalbardensis TaxID=2972972 RepID=A0ABT6DKP5_9BACT|nr:hypothetical protein [Bdellovibrio svalbardensis]MDG0816484.1 hypothetical protein [Bdellovibrio svalbardensis]